MKVLWLCNIMLPMIAKKLGFESSNKEGWLSGLAAEVLKRQQENAITLAVACPMPEHLFEDKKDICQGVIEEQGSKLYYYGFYEDVTAPHIYDEALEERLRKITAAFQPDVVHCFGTEYPHTLAMCRSFPEKERILVGIQGLCKVYADAYFANLPKKTVCDVTFRDFLKKDSILQQQQKFAARGSMEVEAISLAGNVTGRTAWDKYYTEKWNPEAVYHKMNETLRANFYEGQWSAEKCIPHSIFISQGDYPIKGLHYILCALPKILEKYPDAKVYVAGANLTNYKTLKDKLKLSAYGKYLRQLIRKYHLQDSVAFVGRLSAEEMKQQYLRSHLFVCCSSIENSPNSLGEAMLLGMPCVSADVGGVSSIFEDGCDGLLYCGFQNKETSEKDIYAMISEQEEMFEDIVDNLAEAVLEIWSDKDKMLTFCQNARKHATKTHDGEENYRKMTEVYAKIAGQSPAF